MKNEKGGGKQRKRSAQKHRKSSSSSRKGKTTRSLTLAEKIYYEPPVTRLVNVY